MVKNNLQPVREQLKVKQKKLLRRTRKTKALTTPSKSKSEPRKDNKKSHSKITSTKLKLSKSKGHQLITSARILHLEVSVKKTSNSF